MHPNNLDLLKLQQLFNTVINRYYRAKLTSRTLFSLQTVINEIERLCEIIKLISNKKAIKQCNKGSNKLRKLLERGLEQDYINLLNENINEISELTNAMTGKELWFELAYHLQTKFRDNFKKCKLNYEFQNIIKTSQSGYQEIWQFLKANIAVLVILGGVCYSLFMMIAKYSLINEVKNKQLVNLISDINFDSQIELLKILFLFFIFFIIIWGLYVNFIFMDTDLILDKGKIKKINNQREVFKYVGKRIVFLALTLVIYSVLIYILFLSKTSTNTKLISTLGICFLIMVIIVVIMYVYKRIKVILIEVLKNIVIIVLMSLLPILLFLAFETNYDYTVLIPLYALIVECVLIMLCIFIFIDLKIHNVIVKHIINAVIYLIVSFGIIWHSMSYLEFLGLRNNPNVIALVKVETSESNLTKQLQDMGFYQLNYEESETSDLQFESYIFARGIESTVYLAENKKVLVSGLNKYVRENESTICNSKLNRAVLSEFDSGNRSGQYYSYRVCRDDISSFEIKDRNKFANKLFEVRKIGSNYLYWIFGAHINWKRTDELIFSAASNDEINFIQLNKDRGMLYYDEINMRVNQKQVDLNAYSLNRYHK